MVGRKWRRGTWTAGLLTLACSLPGLLGTGCGFELGDPTEKLAIDEDDLDVSVSVRGVLKALFPDLSDEELSELSESLDYEDVLRLKDELESVRKDVVEFSEELFKSSEERAEERAEDLANKNDGYPEAVAALGTACVYDASSGQAELLLSGVFDGKTAVQLESPQLTVHVDGEAQSGTLSCLHTEQTVDIVFLIDITGSMSNVIDSVTRSVVRFVDSIEAAGVRGTISVVTFQDSVGVNTTFQEPVPARLSYADFERSPFFAPVDLSNGTKVEDARRFIHRLEANQGADAPENLAGAIDFARNNTIGGTSDKPNVVNGLDDPPFTAPFPALTSERQVFIAMTDMGFHADDRTASNSSLKAPFVPRDAQVILDSLQQTKTVVHVVDPSWADHPLDPEGTKAQVDADYWAIHTGGLGDDVVDGYSLVDLELIVTAKDTGLLDVALDGIISSSCSFVFDADLSAESQVEVELNVGGDVFSELVAVVTY